jgi:hypothetical protein
MHGASSHAVRLHISITKQSAQLHYIKLPCMFPPLAGLHRLLILKQCPAHFKLPNCQGLVQAS